MTNLSESEKLLEHRVAVEITALYYDPYWKLLWGNNAGVDQWIDLESATPRLKSGQRFRVEGLMIPKKGLRLAESKITVLEDEAVIPTLSAKGRIDDAALLNAHIVRFDGYVNRQVEVDPTHLLLEMDVEGRPVTARLLIGNNSAVPQVEGAFVRVRCLYVADSEPGVGGLKINVWIPKDRDVEIIGWLDRDERFLMPETPIDALPALAPSTFVRVTGLVRSQVAGSSLVLRDETGQVVVHTAMTRAFKPGERVDAIGYANASGNEWVLTQGLVRRSRKTKEEANAVKQEGLPLLRLIDQVRGLKPEEADRGYRVRIRGSVTWSHPTSRTCFVLDVSGGIQVELPAAMEAVPEVGTRVVVHGVSRSGDFAPVIEAEAVDVNDMLLMPEARPVTLEHALTGVEQSQWITLSGYVRAATVLEGPWTRLDLTTSGGEFSALVPSGPRTAGLVGSAVTLKGVCVAETNSRRQLTSIRLWVSRDEDIEIEVPKPADPYDMPLRTIASLRQFSTLDAFIRQVRVTGVVLTQVPGVSLNLQEGDQGLLVLSRETTRVKPGDRIEVVGLPGRQANRVVLREAIFRIIAGDHAPLPLELGRAGTIDPELDGRLVTIDGLLFNVSTRKDGYRFVCQSGGLVFEASLDTPVLPEAAGWRTNSRVALTGVYEIQFGDYGQPQSLHLHLRSPADVKITELASWWTAERTVLVAGLLMVTVVLGLGWVLSLQSRVRRQTREIRAQMEKARSLEAELFRSSKLESLGVLAGGIAHDFNNLLTVVMGNISLVLSDRKIDAEAEHCLRDSERAALRARDLTQQLLTFSKGGAPVRSAVLLSDVVRESAGFALHGSNVRCNFDIGPNVWPADADKGQVAQVVHNVVINAVQAMPTGGVVSIALRNAEVGAGEVATLAPGRYLKLTIADEGAGISREHLSRIFDPYFTTKQRGSGLGLATVYSIVKKHSGHLEVTSKLGVGTTFSIWLPAAEDFVAEVARIETPLLRRSGRALVMDDEPSIRGFMTNLLERIGMEVTAVEDGAAAVKAYADAQTAAAPFALVVLDLTVPAGMGGAEAMAKIRALDPKVCAVVSSGYSKDPVVADYRAHGFRGIVPKPYNFDDVLRVVAAVLPA